MVFTDDNVARVLTSEPFAQETPRIDTRTKRAPERKFGVVSFFMCLGVAMGVFWGVASFGAKIDETNFQIDHLQSQIQAMNIEDGTLKAQVSSLEDPTRILNIALSHGERYAVPSTVIAKKKP